MRKYVKLVCCLYFVGFAAGICGLNLMVKKTGFQTSLLPVYFAVPPKGDGNGAGFFGELLWRRGKLFLAGLVCGITYAGLPAVIMGVLWFGFLAGSLAGLFLLEYGLKGLFLDLACMFPQSLFYIPGWLLFSFVIMQMSQKCWEKWQKEKADYKAYFFFSSGAGIFILLGIWMESYVNQSVLQYILTKWI